MSRQPVRMSRRRAEALVAAIDTALGEWQANLAGEAVAAFRQGRSVRDFEPLRFHVDRIQAVQEARELIAARYLGTVDGVSTEPTLWGDSSGPSEDEASGRAGTV